MKKLIFFLCLMTSGIVAFAAEHHLDVTPHIGLRNYSRGSGVELDYRIVGQFPEHSFIVNPRVIGTFARSVHNSLGVGIRHELGGWVTGIFAFGHHHFFRGYHCFQAGPSIELLGHHWDIRLNGIVPVAKHSRIENHPYFEGELCYKHRYFHVGAGPCVDIASREIGVITRITIPTEFGFFNIHLGKDPVQGFVGKLSITIFKFSSEGFLHSRPVIRHMRLIRLNRGLPVKITPYNQCIERLVLCPEVVRDTPDEKGEYIQNTRKRRTLDDWIIP